MKKIIYFFLISCAFLQALTLDEKYPSYSYVFNEFEVDFSYINNKEFIHFVKKHEKNLKRFYKKSLKRGKKVLPKMQGLLIEEGLSDLFTYQSMIESGFSSKIVSSKKAVGLWQFMPKTAKQYKLKISKKYDERCDLKSATSSAMTYLQKLHKDFGKWYLAVMAYNCGEGRLAKSIKKAHSKDIDILTNSKLKYLPKETREYIQKILLIAMIGENETLGLLGEPEVILEEESPIDVQITQGTTLQDIATLLEVDMSLLKRLNRGKITTNLLIPAEKVYAFYLKYEGCPKKSIEEKNSSFMVMHSVKLGDTLEKIAKKYGTTKDLIKKSNHLQDDFLIVNSGLVIAVEQEVFKKLSS